MFSLTLTNAEVQLAHDSESESIFVALNRVRCCYDEVWMGHGVKLNKAKRSAKPNASLPHTPATSYEGPIT